MLRFGADAPGKFVILIATQSWFSPTKAFPFTGRPNEYVAKSNNPTIPLVANDRAILHQGSMDNRQTTNKCGCRAVERYHNV